MNDWWKMALGGAAGAGLLAMTGGAAAPGLAGLLGTGGAAAGAGAGTAAGTAGATTAGLLGTGAEAATAGGMLAAEGTGAAATGAGSGLFGASGAAGAPGIMSFTTPSVTGATGFGELSGSLAGTDLAYGSPAALADAGAAAAAVPEPGMLAQAGGYAKTGVKAMGAYNAVNNAAGGNQPQMAPPPRPVFGGEAPQIAPQGQAAPNQNAVLAAIARRRQRGY